MPVVQGDVTTSGFGGSSASFPAPAAAFQRLIRIVKASTIRVDITSLTIGLFLANGPGAGTVRTFAVGAMVWRVSPSLDSPPLMALTPGTVFPSGTECLWCDNVYGRFEGTSTIPGTLSEHHFRFELGTVTSDMSRQLLVAVTQPIAADGAANVAGFSYLSVNGIDYGVPSAQAGSVVSNQRSYPRF